MKRLSLAFVFVFMLVVISAVSAANLRTGATVLIRHQVAHCHAWSFDNGKFGAAVSGTIAKGGTITFTNDDVMPHKLFLKSGGKVIFTGKPLMNKMGATVKVTFPKTGVYVFGTKPGEDYTKGIKTTGKDNVLTLKITVS